MKFRLSIGVILLLLAGSAVQLYGQASEADRQEFAAIKARADQDDVEAQLSVASRYGNGNGVGRDPAKAAKYIRKAAEQGSPRAQCLLGLLYTNGDGVKLDKVEAVRWLHRAAIRDWRKPNSIWACATPKGMAWGKAPSRPWRGIVKPPPRARRMPSASWAIVTWKAPACPRTFPKG